MPNAAEWAVLALVAEGRTHGFAIARALEDTGPVGAIWTLRRPLVYRALDALEADELVTEVGVEPGASGPPRRLLEITPEGRARVSAWLHEPVEHVREARALLLLKLLFHDRAGSDPGRLIAAQLERFREQLAGLQERRDALEGFDRTAMSWRCANTRAAIDFLAELR